MEKEAIEITPPTKEEIQKEVFNWGNMKLCLKAKGITTIKDEMVKDFFVNIVNSTINFILMKEKTAKEIRAKIDSILKKEDK